MVGQFRPVAGHVPLFGQVSPPRALNQRSSKAFVIWTVSFSVFTDIFLYGVIVPVIPFVLQDRIGISHGGVQRWTSILLATFGWALLVSSVLTGWLCDKIHLRRPLFLGALAAQLAATVMLCFATSIGLLLAARVLQGISGGVVWTISLIIMIDRVGSAELGKMLGYSALARSTGVVTGPLLGGVLYQRCGYYSVFALSFAFLIIDGFFRLTFIEARTAITWNADGYPGKQDDDLGEEQKLSVREIEPITPSQSKPGPVFRQLTHRLHSRLPPVITLLGSSRLDVALWGSFIQALLLSGLDATIPIFVSRTFHWNSLAAGLVFLALVIPSFISPVVGWLSDKHGPRWYAAAGYILSAIPLILLRLVKHDTTPHKVLLSALLAVFGATYTLFEIPLWAEMIRSAQLRAEARPRQYTADVVGQACGLSNFFFALGMTVGPLLTGLVYEAAGWGNMVLVLGLLSAASAVPTVLCTGGGCVLRKRRKEEEEEEGPSALPRG